MDNLRLYKIPSGNNKFLRVYLLALFGLVIWTITLIDINIYLRITIIITVSVQWFIIFYRNFIDKLRIVKIYYCQNQRWQLTSADNHTFIGELCATSWVSENLLVLRWRIDCNYKTIVMFNNKKHHAMISQLRYQLFCDNY